MSDFGFSITSIGGLYTGRFPSAGTLAGCPANNEPVSSGSSMQMWGPHVFDSSGAQDEWIRYMKDTIRQDVHDIGSWIALLSGGGYVSESTARTIAEFAFVDGAGEVIPDQALCLRTFTIGGNMAIFMAKKQIVDSQTTTYTTVSNIRQISPYRMVSFGITCGRFLRGGKVWYCFGACYLNLDGVQIEGQLFTNDAYGIETLFGYHLQPGEEYSEEFGPANTPGGYTGYTPDGPGDDIDIPTAPPSALGAGLGHLYKADTNSLRNLASELFPVIPKPTASITTLDDVVEWVGEVLWGLTQSIFNKDLIDYVVDIKLVPCDPTAGALEGMQLGGRTLQNVSVRPVSSEYVDVDFQTVNITEVYKNFGDYISNVRLFLPFYGFIPLDVQEVMGGSVGVKYRFNLIDGSFMAYVTTTSNRSKKNNGLIGQYGGSACIHLPLSGRNYAAMFSNVVGGGVSLAAGVDSKNVSGAISGATQIMSTVGGGGGSVKSNSYNSSSGMMSRRRPFIITEKPVSAFSAAYADEKGIPSNCDFVLGNCHGFTKIMDPILDGMTGATDDDIQEIRQLLMEGVYL